MNQEESVTKLLCNEEIIHKNKLKANFCSLPVNGYDLNEYLKNNNDNSSRFGYKYFFVK